MQDQWMIIPMVAGCLLVTLVSGWIVYELSKSILEVRRERLGKNQSGKKISLKISKHLIQKWIFLSLGFFGLIFLPTGSAGTYGRMSNPSWEFFWMTSRTVDTTRLLIQSAVLFGLAFFFFWKDSEKSA